MGSSSATFKGIDFGSSTPITIELQNIINNAPAGAFGLSGLANSGNVLAGRLATVTGCEFAGGMTDLENITPADIRWDMRDNTPTADSRNAVDIYMIDGPETIVTGIAGNWQEIGTPVGAASWVSDVSDRFSVGTDGVITYIGEREIEARISGRATVQKSGGGADVIEVRVAINWDGTPADSGLEKSRAQTQNTDPTTIPIGALFCLAPNDNIRAIFSNITGASNIIATVSSLEVTG